MKKTIYIILFIFSNSSFYSQNVNGSIKKLETLLRTIDMFYVDTVDVHKIVEDAIVHVLDQLDPHSVYIPKDEVQKANEPLSGNFEGIGVSFNILNDTIFVVSPIIGGPSEKLGILSGDKIIKIDQELVAGVGIKNSDVFKRLRGKKGTKVVVSILRKGEKDFIDFTITRDKIPIYSIDASYMVDEQTGYIKLSRFAQTTMDEITTKMSELKAQGMQKLILDLTNNSGGYLHIANQLSDEFLSERKMIVYTEGKRYPKNESFATQRGQFEKGELVIMIDEGSASASEIVSGAIQDWDRGLIVGRRSFGKGLVQKPYDFSDSSMMRLTIQRYYTPSGRCIQKPYEEYNDDFSNRFEKGELFYLDSIKTSDSLVYYTKNGRRVYGGGGIIPDVFVPLDTTYNTKFYRDVLRKGLLNSYSLNYLDKSRKDLIKQYPDYKKFTTGYYIDDSLWNNFLAEAEKEGVEKNEEQIEISKKVMQIHLKGLIARGLYGESAYFYISNSVNPIYQKAVELLNKPGYYDRFQLAE